ncbi:MAG: acetyltransferase [Myxococcales bacterium]|nr:acetyltransferase [Myxococcales bacterium]
MALPPLVVLGASGHGKVVADTARAAGRAVLGFADDDPARRGVHVVGAPVLAIGADELRATLDANGAELVLAIGRNATRQRLAGVWSGVPFATLVHPRAWVSPTATLGAGTVVFAGAVVQADARVGEHAILNTGCSVDHDNVLGDFVHVSPGARLGGTVTVGEGTHIGIGASVRNNLHIGAWSVVGAGAAVVADLPDSVTAYGVPARVRGSVPR